jgi:hypothetical protein
MPNIETAEPTAEELDALDRWISRRGILSPLVPGVDETGCFVGVTFYRTTIEEWETGRHHGEHVTRATWITAEGRVIRVWFAMASYTSTTVVVKLADHLDSRTGRTKRVRQGQVTRRREELRQLLGG